MSRRSLLAKSMEWTGLTRALELSKGKPGVLIITHHRIGDPGASRFDRAVFSATSEQLSEQVSYLKRQFPVVGEEELESLVTGKKPVRRTHVAITFDDGYLDNYSHAFPVMRSHGCDATFFVVPAYVGTNAVPWWDEIAYLVRNSVHAALSLRLPEPLTVHLEDDRELAIRRVLQHYRRPDNTRQDEFMEELRYATGCAIPEVARRFLDWDEAREMQRAGMTIGSHTLTHRVLAQLSPEEQRDELRGSRRVLEERLQCTITSLAYPVGGPGTFTPETQHMAQAAGYRCCFSFMGGINAAGRMRSTDLVRTSAAPDPLMFRNEMVLLSRFGRLPYA